MTDIDGKSQTALPSEDLVTLTHIIYGLHAFSVLTGISSTAFIVTAFLSGWPSIIAVIINYVKRDNVRGLMDLISAADDKQGATIGRQALMVLFDAQNPVMTRDLALEVFAKGNAGTGNAAAKAGAAAWLKITDQMRQRFNAGGARVQRGGELGGEAGEKLMGQIRIGIGPGAFEMALGELDGRLAAAQLHRLSQ